MCVRPHVGQRWENHSCAVVSYFPTPPAHVSMESKICILLPSTVQPRSSSGELIPYPCPASILHSNLKGKFSWGVPLHFGCCCLEESELGEQCWMAHTTLCSSLPLHPSRCRMSFHVPIIRDKNKSRTGRWVGSFCCLQIAPLWDAEQAGGKCIRHLQRLLKLGDWYFSQAPVMEF